MNPKTFFSCIFVPFFLFSCSQPVVVDDLSDASFTLLNADSTQVVFPDDFEGQKIMLGFVYTNCPDICSMITANLKKVQAEMNTPDDVEFVVLSFDPLRDTPSVLKRYKQSFGVDEHFTFLTGDTTEVNRALKRLKVRTQVSYRDTTSAGKELYFLNHSDKIMLIDEKSRIRYEYGGSMTKPAIFIEDLEKL